MTISIRPASIWLSRVSRLPTGSQIMFAVITPHRVATNAPAIRWPSLSGWDRFSSTCTRPMTVPMMPMVGA